MLPRRLLVAGRIFHQIVSEPIYGSGTTVDQSLLQQTCTLCTKQNYSWMHVRVGQFTSQRNHLITPLSVLLFHWVFFSCLLHFLWGGAHGYLVKHDPRWFLASPVWLLILTHGRIDITWFIVPTNVSFCVHFVTWRGALHPHKTRCRRKWMMYATAWC